ncbi:MAG: hypothetical protein U9P12_04625, partial [Verrucomicrobiota bacterium]|nr:hypothetical protein [Verrucomicrobiota bacterium]
MMSHKSLVLVWSIALALPETLAHCGTLCFIKFSITIGIKPFQYFLAVSAGATTSAAVTHGFAEG